MMSVTDFLIFLKQISNKYIATIIPVVKDI